MLMDYIQLMNHLNNSLENLFSHTLDVIPKLDSQPALAVHELRKQTKFMRALLLLNQAAPTPLKQLLKSLSALLAPYRDAQVNVDTYKFLTENAPTLQDSDFENWLSKSPYYLDSTPIPELRKNIETLLTELVPVMGKLPDPPMAASILDSIDASFELASKSMIQVKIDSNMEDLHTWRKKTKSLWYQLRFLFGDNIEDFNHPLNLSDQLGQLLGDIHDSDVFDLLLTIDPASNLREVVSKRRSELLQEAFKTGEELYVEGRPYFNQLLQEAL